MGYGLRFPQICLKERVYLECSYFSCFSRIMHFPISGFSSLSLILLRSLWLFTQLTLDLDFFQDGLTELHWAAICGRDGIVRYLLKRGADAKAVDKVSNPNKCSV